MHTLNKEAIAEGFRQLQAEICASLEQADGQGRFGLDAWQRPGGGGGLTRTLEAGAIIEKGGVNFSAVQGLLPEKVATGLKLSQEHFFATGVSIVLHPRSPMVPIIHMNVRYFELESGLYWFGGGIDLTPHYVLPQDACWFHTQLKEVCDRYDASYYPRFKEWADDYFYIKHRKETRGIGGIFFDRLSSEAPGGKQALWDFVQDVGRTFAPIYTHFMALHAHEPYGEQQQQWQRLRRGRYVEFNLVLDKGTKFGLDTDGRIESILMSLPPLAAWEYDHQPEPDTPEAYTLQQLRKGIDWAGYR